MFPWFPLVACTTQSSFPKRPISFVPLSSSLRLSHFSSYHYFTKHVFSLTFYLLNWILGYVQWMSFERSVFRKTRNTNFMIRLWRSFIVFILWLKHYICKKQVTVHSVPHYQSLIICKQIRKRYVIYCFCVMCCLCLLCVCYRPFWKHFEFFFNFFRFLWTCLSDFQSIFYID